MLPNQLLSTEFHRLERPQCFWPSRFEKNTKGISLVVSTDATPWRERGVPVYDMGPFPVDPESRRRIHGDDERIEIEAVRQGSEFVYRALLGVAAK